MYRPISRVGTLQYSYAVTRSCTLQLRGNTVVHIRHQRFPKDFVCQKKINGFDSLVLDKLTGDMIPSVWTKIQLDKHFFQGPNGDENSPTGSEAENSEEHVLETFAKLQMINFVL